ncbi:hypothetical protein [Klebsiella pneumoniae]|uniref:hypothetical protein n=3 Tax=Klebsiella pneumoniae TaxID=573 RepID=UPI00178257FA|nr:hypothetical protein [Klebsiella pneumoniae]
MEEEIKYNIEVDCSTLESAAKEIRALKGLLATMFVCLDQDMKGVVIHQLSQIDDEYNQKNLEMLKEGANKQVISSQADSLIKISRIWADFFPANTSNQPI